MKRFKIGLVKYRAVKTAKHAEGKISQQPKNNRAKFPQLHQAEGKKNEVSYTKSVETFITNCVGPY